MRKEVQDKDISTKAGNRYDEYYNQVLVKEQPFYHSGMTAKEAAKEMQYLNDNLEAFYKGNYMPLWKQNLYR